MAIACWYADVRQLEDDALFMRGMDALPWDDRRERVGRFRFARGQRLCLAGGLLIAHALRDWGVDDLALTVGEHGKPQLAHETGVHFNLSHAGDICACAVSAEPVGVDVEIHHDLIEGVARRCYQDHECVWIHAQPDEGLAFSRLWTRKESYLKLLGTGFAREPNSFAALPGDEEALGVAFFEREVEGHLLCVCSATCLEVTLKRYDLEDLR